MNLDAAYPLYENVREKICRKIYDGVFEEGEKIPPERNLAQMLDVSRITLRKSLDLLVERDLIIKEVGSGNRVNLPNYGTKTNTDMIVLIAPAENPFFSNFIKSFQEYGQKHGSMVLYVEKPYKESLVDSIYRFYQKGIHNIVIWQEDAKVDLKKLRILRALGMNMVFFDTDIGLPYADSVVLDNESAVRRMFRILKKRGTKSVGYVGWERGPEYSRKVREEYVLLQPRTELLVRLPWHDRKAARQNLLLCLKKRPVLPEVIVYSDMEAGSLLSDVLKELGKEEIALAGIDDFQGVQRKGNVVCIQDFKSMIKKIFECIEAQNLKTKEWKAELYKINGRVTEYL